jgi:hypothetical protein
MVEVASSRGPGTAALTGRRDARALHSGRIGDYIAWTAVGAAVIASASR